MACPLACDWLVPSSARCCPTTASTVAPAAPEFGPGAFTLSNGLVSRTFSTRPSFALLELRHLGTQERFSRGVSAEGVVLLDGRNYTLGGLEPLGSFTNLTRLSELSAGIDSFRYLRHSARPVRKRFDWTPGQRHSSANAQWPPKGIGLRVDLCAPHQDDHHLPDGMMATLAYELYDGVPALSKRVTLTPLAPACLEWQARHRSDSSQSRQSAASSLGPVRGCTTLGGMSIEALRLSPRALGVPYEDENWRYLQGRRISVFTDFSRPGLAHVVAPDEAYNSSPRDRLSVLHAALPRPTHHGHAFEFEVRICASGRAAATTTTSTSSSSSCDPHSLDSESNPTPGPSSSASASGDRIVAGPAVAARVSATGPSAQVQIIGTIDSTYSCTSRYGSY